MVAMMAPMLVGLFLTPKVMKRFGISNICAAPLTADGNALIASISDYTYKKEGMRMAAGCRWF